MPLLTQFLPLKARTSDPANIEGGGISIVLAKRLFTDHKNYVVNECYLVDKVIRILRSVPRPNVHLQYGIYQSLLSLGGRADEARFVVTVRNYSGHLTTIRLYKLPKTKVVLSWQDLMRAHRTPEEIAADKEHLERGRVRQRAAEEASRFLQDA